MRWPIICVCGLLLTACNEVTGNERGGIIDGAPVPDGWIERKEREFGIEVMFAEDALQKASSHCARYGKKARITSVASGKTLFECS